MATKQDTTQCRALTEDGERCTRPAGEDGFCYQHGPEDETVDDAEGGDDAANADREAEVQATDGGDGSGGQSSVRTGAGDGDVSGLMDVRVHVEAITSDVVGAPLDRIIEIERRDDEGWLVVIEAVERNAIPDTEDLLGRYAIRLDQDGAVDGYRLRERYRRGSDIDDG
ncbi:gas vesicle protein GvpO, halophile-type [Halorarum halobium]|uniref:gas vesicle protein GvpO, halophile-type n=1 Tax=Halorarum halobium TaxID=3075121 RepID=UPI0028A70C29|nr:gas vesicle protein GvpO [Halobaculum sp. XH14]